mmetsp:Transcript_7680/g.13599  ORF Transcript_7680/g.13599 Transcript_7680/m.13599 type:complete len:212 (+) Transcript_7680:1979-2614(+)
MTSWRTSCRTSKGSSRAVGGPCQRARPSLPSQGRTTSTVPSTPCSWSPTSSGQQANTGSCSSTLPPSPPIPHCTCRSTSLTSSLCPSTRSSGTPLGSAPSSSRRTSTSTCRRRTLVGAACRPRPARCTTTTSRRARKSLRTAPWPSCPSRPCGSGWTASSGSRFPRSRTTHGHWPGTSAMAWAPSSTPMASLWSWSTATTSTPSMQICRAQ